MSAGPAALLADIDMQGTIAFPGQDVPLHSAAQSTARELLSQTGKPARQGAGPRLLKVLPSEAAGSRG